MKSLFLLVLSIASIFLGAAVFDQLWFWYLEPIGVVEIGLVHAMGLRLFFGYATESITVYKNHKIDHNLGIIVSFIYPILVFIFGYIFQLFM